MTQQSAGGLTGFRQRIVQLPPLQLFLFYFLVFGLLTWVLAIAIGPERANWVGLVAHLGSGLLFAAIMTPVTLRMRRRTGGFSVASQVNFALKSQTLPDGADPAEWRPLLEYRHKQSRWLRWVTPLEFGLFAALGVWLSLTDPRWMIVGWVFVALFVGWAVYGTYLSFRNCRRSAVLLQRLGDTPAS